MGAGKKRGTDGRERERKKNLSLVGNVSGVHCPETPALNISKKIKLNKGKQSDIKKEIKKQKYTIKSTRIQGKLPWR